MIKQKVCPKCGYDVYIKADLSWDEEKQDWVVVWTNDQNGILYTEGFIWLGDKTLFL